MLEEKSQKPLEAKGSPSRTRQQGWPPIVPLLGTTLVAGMCAFGCQNSSSPSPSPSLPTASSMEEAGTGPQKSNSQPPPPPTDLPIAIEASPKVLRNGKVVVFTVRIPKTNRKPSSLSATFGKRQASVAKYAQDGSLWKILSSIPISRSPGKEELNIKGRFDDGSPLIMSRTFPFESAEYDVRQIHVSNRFMKPNPAQRAQAAGDRKKLNAAFATLSDERLWRGGFVRPTQTHSTSPFGTLRTYNTRRKQSRHLGLDLDGKVGDPIVAAQRGRAALVQKRFYSGGTVLLDHGGGLVSLYFHMSAFAIKEGDIVEKGQLLGQVGKSGRVTGPHLHFAVKMGGVYVDPVEVLALDLSGDPLEPSAPSTTEQSPSE